MSVLGGLGALGAAAIGAWDRLRDWHARRRLERAKARAARTERELEAISEEANRMREEREKREREP